MAMTKERHLSIGCKLLKLKALLPNARCMKLVQKSGIQEVAAIKILQPHR